MLSLTEQINSIHDEQTEEEFVKNVLFSIKPSSTSVFTMHYKDIWDNWLTD